MGVIELKFSKNQYRRMLDGEIAAYDFIEEVLRAPANIENQGFDTICSHLQDNYSGDGGAPDVQDFEIADVTYDKVAKKGSVDLDYEVYFYYGCADMNNSRDSSQGCTFSINVQTLTLTLDIPDTQIRDTVDEF